MVKSLNLIRIFRSSAKASDVFIGVAIVDEYFEIDFSLNRVFS